MSALAGQLERLLSRINAGARVEDIMREDERKAGRQVVRPGEVPWLPASEWDPTIVVSIDRGKVVRLIAIIAIEKGKGSFRRLVCGIEAAGLVPCIVEPTSEMRATLKRWGWRGKRHGYGFESEERWWPRSRASQQKGDSSK